VIECAASEHLLDRNIEEGSEGAGARVGACDLRGPALAMSPGAAHDSVRGFLADGHGSVRVSFSTDLWVLGCDGGSKDFC